MTRASWAAVLLAASFLFVGCGSGRPQKADVSGDEVEAWMLANNVVAATDAEADAPTDQPCAHEMPEAQSMQFKN